MLASCQGQLFLSLPSRHSWVVGYSNNVGTRVVYLGWFVSFTRRQADISHSRWIRRLQNADDSDKDLRFSFQFSETAINRELQFCHGVPAQFLHQSFLQFDLPLLQGLAPRMVLQALLVWIRGHHQREARHFLGSELLFCFAAILPLFFLGSIFRSNLFLEFWIWSVGWLFRKVLWEKSEGQSEPVFEQKH